MANIKWCQSPNADDCLDDGEWDLMVAYIKHSAVVDFTIYGTENDCVDTGQAFKFSQAGVVSQMYGGADSGDDMIIYANSTDTYPFISLFGDEGVDIDVADDEEILFKEGGAQFFKFDHSGTNSQLYGSAIGNSDLTLYANSSDALPKIELNGNSAIALYVANDTEISFIEGGAEFFRFDRSGTRSILSGSAAGANDLLIYANLNDDCSMIELLGNAGMTCKVKATTTFEVSTCSDETLFEIGSAAGDHRNDFHCADADNFVLENRTDDPGSPCTGQIWFRSDLV